jgi:hypothetical protein
MRGGRFWVKFREGAAEVGWETDFAGEFTLGGSFTQRREGKADQALLQCLRRLTVGEGCGCFGLGCGFVAEGELRGSQTWGFWEGGGCLVVGMLAPKRCKHGTVIVSRVFGGWLRKVWLPVAARPDHLVVGPPAAEGET